VCTLQALKKVMFVCPVVKMLKVKQLNASGVQNGSVPVSVGPVEVSSIARFGKKVDDKHRYVLATCNRSIRYWPMQRKT